MNHFSPLNNNGLFEDLGDRGEKILLSNIVPTEQISIKLKGSHGEGFVVTNKHILVLKWGFMTGNTFGGRCMSFDFHNITGIEFKKGLLTGTIEVLNAANQNSRKGYWSIKKEDNALNSDNIVTFQRNKFSIFENAARIARGLISNKNNISSSESGGYDDLEKLMQLKEKGVISEEEFQKKKRQVLGI